MRSVLHLHANEVHQGSALFSVERCREEREAVDDAVAREFVVHDRQMALLERADADAGGLEFRAGEEHELAEPCAQVAFRRDFRGGFGAHDADLVRGLGEIGKWLTGLVNARRNHLCARARRRDENDGESGGAKNKVTKLGICSNSHGAGTSGGAGLERSREQRARGRPRKHHRPVRVAIPGR